MEAHFGDGFGLDPGRRCIELRLFDERAALSLQRIQPRLHLHERALVEAGADVRGVTELAPRLTTVPVADEERTERGTRALSPAIPADNEVRTMRGLDLQPRRRAAAAFVAAFLALADHALEAVGNRRCLQCHPVFRRVHELHAGGGQQTLRKIAPPIAVRRLAQIDSSDFALGL